MPVTHSLIGTGITMRVSTHISSPFGEEEVAAGECLFEALGQESTFEGIAVSWEVCVRPCLTRLSCLPKTSLFMCIWTEPGRMMSLRTGSRALINSSLGNVSATVEPL